MGMPRLSSALFDKVCAIEDQTDALEYVNSLRVDDGKRIRAVRKATKQFKKRKRAVGGVNPLDDPPTRNAALSSVHRGEWLTAELEELEQLQ